MSKAKKSKTEGTVNIGNMIKALTNLPPKKKAIKKTAPKNNNKDQSQPN